MKPDEETRYEEFWAANKYFAGSYDKRQDFEMLNQELCKAEGASRSANRLFYLALPPSVFEAVTVHIRNTCMGEK